MEDQSLRESGEAIISILTKQPMQLTTTEKTELQILENEIGRGLFAAGNALKTIRDQKLYRAEYSTFDEYCQNRWSMGRQYAYQQIEAAEVASSLPPNVSHWLTNEKQARVLAGVPLLERAEVLTSAAASGSVTAASIEAAADEWKPGLTQTAQIEKIGRIWDRFKNLEGKPETVLVASVNAMRETGLHLQGLAGHERLSAGKFLKLKESLPDDMTFDKAKNCVRLVHKFKNKATLQDCGSEAETVMQVRGAVKVAHRSGKQQAHTETPFVTVAGIFGDVRVGLEKVFAGKDEWASGMKESIIVEIKRQEAYLKEARENL